MPQWAGQAALSDLRGQSKGRERQSQSGSAINSDPTPPRRESHLTRSMDAVLKIARLVWDSLERNVLNLALAVVALRCLWDLLLLLVPVSDPLQLRKREPIARSHAEGYSWMPAAYPESMLWRDYTPRDLAACDGTDGAPIRLAIRGNVYDVSASGRRFYGPGGPYSYGGPFTVHAPDLCSNFGGRDATRGLAKQSFDDDMLAPVDGPIDPVDDLSPSELDNLRGLSDAADLALTPADWEAVRLAPR